MIGLSIGVGAAVYAVGWVISWRLFAGLIAYEFGPPEGDDVFSGVFFGAFIALLWPVAIPGRLLYKSGVLGRVGTRLVRRRCRSNSFIRSAVGTANRTSAFESLSVRWESQ